MLAIILASYLMIVLDISIVITALPKIRDGLDFSHTGLSWVQNAYPLAFGGLLLLGARAGDILGRRRMFVIGLALFTAASLGVGLAQSAFWMIAARALQGVGAAILAPSTLALLTTNFPEGAERTRALAYYAAVAGIGASLGLVLGGILTDWISWRVGFFINVPIGIALMLGAQRYFAETERRSGDAGAASGLVNVAHQFGGSLGLGILVTAFAAAGVETLDVPALLAQRISASLTAGTALLAFALAPVVVLIVRPRKPVEPAENVPAR